MSFQFTIRPYEKASDRRQLKLIHLPEKYIQQYTNSSPLFFTLEKLGICSNHLYVMTASNGGDIVGTILLRKRLQGLLVGYGWKIHAVGVIEKLRGQGLGFELMHYAFERLREHGAQEVSLKVDASNEPAIRLYRKCGFAETARTKDQIIFSKRVNA